MKSIEVRLILLLLVIVIAAGCPSNKSGDADKPLAIVNGQTVTRDQFLKLFHDGRSGNTENLPSDPVTWLQLKLAFLDQIVERMLIDQEAARRSITVVDADVNGELERMRADWPEGAFETMLAEKQITPEMLRENLHHDLLTDMIAKKVVLPSIEVSEEEIQSYYRRNDEMFTRPEQVRGRQILVRTEAQAAEILTRLLTGGSFIDLAKEHSIAPEAEKGGDLGYFGRDQMPKVVEDACFALGVRQTSDIIKSNYGYHIFRVEDRRPAIVIPLNTARPQIVAAVKGEKADEAWQKFLANLKSEARIKIDEAQLASIKQEDI